MILDQFKLTDKVALVTGSGRGIALAFAEAGAHVVCSARTAADIEETAKLVRERGRESLAVRCDVLVTEQLEQLVAAALERFGRIDLLVNNAGGAFPKPALALSERAFAAYGSAKAGLNQLTRILAAEFAPKVRVNAIVVGQIDTPGAASVLSDEVKRQAAARIPMQRIGAETDIAACALYLASPAAAWVTGRSIDVDGGADAAPLDFPVPRL